MESVAQLVESGKDGLLYRVTEHSADFSFKDDHKERAKGPPKYIFWTKLKKSHQDLSNKGSNFILSSLENGH